MPSVWQWPADKITHVPHGLHTYVHCASITGQPVKAMHSNVSLFLHQCLCLCVCGGRGGDGKGALHVG